MGGPWEREDEMRENFDRMLYHKFFAITEWERLRRQYPHLVKRRERNERVLRKVKETIAKRRK